MANKIQFRRGAQAELPALAAGEPGFTLDTGQVYVGTPAGQNVQLQRADAPAPDELVYAIEAGQTVAVNDFVHLIEGKLRKTLGHTGEATNKTASTFNNASTQLNVMTKMNDTSAIITYQSGATNGAGLCIVATIENDAVVYGAPVTFAASVNHLAACRIDGTRFAIAYKDIADGFGKVVIGTVNGNEITLGTPVTAAAQLINYRLGITAVDENTLVFAYTDVSPQYGHVKHGTVTGNTVAFGAAVAFTNYAAYDPYIVTVEPGKFAIVVDASGTNYGRALIGTVTGGAFTFGTAITLADYASPVLVALSPSRLVVAFTDIGVNQYGTAMTLTVAGTTLTASGKYVFEGGNGIGSVSIDRIDDNTFALAYRGDQQQGRTIVGTVNGTTNSIAYSAYNMINAGYSYTPTIAMMTADRALIAYGDNATNTGKATVAEYGAGRISITPIFSTYQFRASDTSYITVTPLDNTRFVVAYQAVQAVTGYVVLATIEGDTIRFGPAQSIGANATSIVVEALDSSTIVIGFQENTQSNWSRAKIATLSGETFTFGALIPIRNATTTQINVARLSPTSFLYTGNLAGLSFVTIGHVNGLTATFPVSGDSRYGPSSIGYSAATALDANRFIITFTDTTTGAWPLKAVIGTYNETDKTITYGTIFDVGAKATQQSVSKLGANRFVIAFNDNTNVSKAVVGTVSGGNAITFGTILTTETTAGGDTVHVKSLDDDRFIILNRDLNAGGQAIIGTAAGTAITLGQPITLNAGDTRFFGAALIDPAKVAIVYQNAANSSAWAMVLYTSGNRAFRKVQHGYFGFVVRSVQDGSARVRSTGLQQGFTGLEAGKKYFWQYDGSISSNPRTIYEAGIAVDESTMRLLCEDTTK